MEDITKKVKSLEDSGLLIKEATRTITQEKKSKGIDLFVCC